jgi:hypothetical protein
LNLSFWLKGRRGTFPFYELSLKRHPVPTVLTNLAIWM